MIYLVLLLQFFNVTQALFGHAPGPTGFHDVAIVRRDDNKDTGGNNDDNKNTDNNNQDSKNDDNKNDDNKSDDSKSDDSKTDDSKKDDNKDDNSKSGDSKKDDKNDDNNDKHDAHNTNQNSTTTGDKTSSSQPKTTSTSSSISVDPRMPVGAISLTSPASTSTTYIKSGDVVTFGWNYTNIINSPPALNIEVACTQNHQTYTLAQNQSLKSSSFIWDTNKATASGALHLISAQYTLRIYDASKSQQDPGSAGALAPFEYEFGVYIPQKYTSWAPGAKYVNLAIRVNPPAIMTLALSAVFGALIFML